jgi:hypothetical protein
LTENEIEKILSSICSCIGEDQPNEDIKLTGLKAFQFSHSYFSGVMQKDDIRTFVMDLIVKCTIRPGNSTDVAMLAWECLTDISTALYDHLANYLPVISKLSTDLINSATEDETCIIPAIEFWNSIAQEEASRKQSGSCQKRCQSQNSAETQRPNRDYIPNYKTGLLQAILLSLRKVQNDDFGSNNLSVFSSAHKCLLSLFEVLGDNSIDLTTQFITAFIGNQSWQDKCAT